MWSLVPISRTLLVKSVMPAIGAAIMVAAVKRAIRLRFRRAGLRWSLGFWISVSRSSRSMMTPSWISAGNWVAVWRRVVMSCRSSVVVTLFVWVKVLLLTVALSLAITPDIGPLKF